jgi:hypothetical protein
MWEVKSPSLLGVYRKNKPPFPQNRKVPKTLS